VQGRDGIAEGVFRTGVTGVTLHRFPLVEDLRRDLTAGEFARTIPIIPKRYFLVFDVPSRRVRGEYAHVACEQFLVGVNGSLSVVADDGTTREEFLLDSRNLGLYLAPDDVGRSVPVLSGRRSAGVRVGLL
jgi:UDP-2-acetamido-3-amino-2,3-dideoxy-glucuronate N-acetyltransferase